MTCTGRKSSAEVSMLFKANIIDVIVDVIVDIIILMQNMIVMTFDY